MQTFSRMRRNSTDQNVVELFLICTLLFAGLVLSSIYTWIPSFAGFLFCYSMLAFKQENARFPLFLVFVYLALYDMHKGFFLFSYALLFALFYPLATQKLQYMTSCENCILTVYVTVGYLGHFLLNLILAYFFNMPFPYFSNHYFYAIAIDALLAFAFLRVSR